MKTILIFLFSIVIAVDQTITIKKENASTFNGGKFEGFGTNFCWRPNRLGYPDVLAEKAAIAFYE